MGILLGAHSRAIPPAVGKARRVQDRPLCAATVAGCEVPRPAPGDLTGPRPVAPAGLGAKEVCGALAAIDSTPPTLQQAGWS